MARKRILKKTQSDSDDSFDEEEAIKIYSKNPYEPRLPTDLETIFEHAIGGQDDPGGEISSGPGRGRRKCFDEATKSMTRVPRRLETKYWIEDKEKEKKRKSMVSKLLRGRKKLKFRGLTIEQEENLIAVIESLDKASPPKSEKVRKEVSPDSADEIKFSSRCEQSKNSELDLCKKSTDNNESQIISESELKLFGESLDELEWAPLPKSSSEVQDFNNKKTDTRRQSRKSARRVSTLFQPLKEVLKDNSLNESQLSSTINATETELAKQIEEADSVFGPIGFNDEINPNIKDNGSNLISTDESVAASRNLSLQTFSRRSSMLGTQKFKVRRSSRLFRQNNTDVIIGAIYEELTYTVKKKGCSSSPSKEFSNEGESK